MQLTVNYKGAELGQVLMPSLDLHTGSGEFQLDTPFEIKDHDAFQLFSETLIQTPSFIWNMVGQCDLTVMGTTIKNLQFNKRAFFTGMNQFPAVKIDDFTLYTVPKATINDTIQMKVQTTLTNPSVIGMDLGDLTFDVLFKEHVIGQVASKNVSLISGPNKLMLVGDLVKSSNSSAQFSELFTNYVNGLTSDLRVVGTGLTLPLANSTSGGMKAASLNDAAAAPWLSDAVKHLSISVPLKQQPPQNVTGNVSPLIQNVNVTQMYVEVPPVNSTGQAPPDPYFSAGSVVVDFKMPFDFPINVTSNQQSIDVYDGDILLGHMETAWIPASNEANPSQIIMILPRTQLVLERNTPQGLNGAFPDFLTKLFRGTSGQFEMRGFATVKANTGVGRVTLSNIPFKQVLSVKGMQTLTAVKDDGRKTNPIIRGLRVNKATPDTVHMETDIVLYSVGSIGNNLGDVRLELFLMKPYVQIGYTILPNLTVLTGDNFITCRTYLQPKSEEARVAVEGMVSDYINGKAVDVRMLGTNMSTPNALISDAISYLNLTAPLNGMTDRLVQSALLKINPFTTAFTHKGQTQFRCKNPFDTQFAFSNMSADIVFRGDKLAVMNVDLTNGTQVPGLRNVTVPARQTLNAPYLPVMMDSPLSADSMTALRYGIGGEVKVDVDAKIDAVIDQYAIQIHYVQKNLTSKITLL